MFEATRRNSGIVLRDSARKSVRLLLHPSGGSEVSALALRRSMDCVVRSTRCRLGYIWRHKRRSLLVPVGNPHLEVRKELLILCTLDCRPTGRSSQPHRYNAPRLLFSFNPAFFIKHTASLPGYISVIQSAPRFASLLISAAAAADPLVLDTSRQGLPLYCDPHITPVFRCIRRISCLCCGEMDT